MPFIEKANQPVVWRFGSSFVKVSTGSRAASAKWPSVYDRIDARSLIIEAMQNE
jgi:hypothetical protein